jgi:general secretion pathway protein K
MKQIMNRDKGFALLFTLWVLLLLTVIGMSFSYSLKIERETAVAHTEHFQAEMAAAFSTKRVILALLSSTKDQQQRYNRIPLSLTLDGFKIETITRSEAGKINLNLAPIEILTGLFSQFAPMEKAEQMAAALIDWRDPDSETLSNGAEKDTYIQAGYTYQPANRALKSVSELGQIFGFSPDLITRIMPFVTIYSNTSKVDPLSTTATVLASLPGIDHEVAEAFITERDALFEQQSTVNLDILSPASQYLAPDHTQSIVNIVSTVRSPGNALYSWEACVLIEQNKKQYKIIEWMAANEQTGQ